MRGWQRWEQRAEERIGIGADGLKPSRPVDVDNSGELRAEAVGARETLKRAPETLMTRSADCSNKGGWHYDNLAAPTQIVMCSDICATLQNDVTGGKIDIVFGCTTSVPPGGGLPK